MATEEQVTSRVIQNIFGDVFDDKKIAEMTEREIRNQESRKARGNTTSSSNTKVGPKQPPKNPAKGGSKGSPKIPPKVGTEGKYTTGTGSARQLKNQSSPLSAYLQRALQSGKGLLGTVGRIPGIGLLGRGAALATGPIGLGLTGAYMGARALGYDPLGLNTEEPREPTSIGYDYRNFIQPPTPETRFSQIFNPTAQATGKEIINAALMRAALGQDVGSVADFRTKFRTGKQALEAGKANLGENARVNVQQTKDGDYVYSGGQTGTAIDLLNNLKPKQEITLKQFNDYLLQAREENPEATDEEIIKKLESEYTVKGE